MKKTILDKWCGQPWLHATYFLGIVMTNVLIINWGGLEHSSEVDGTFDRFSAPTCV